MFTKHHSKQLPFLHEGNAFSGSDWFFSKDASTFLPGKPVNRLDM